jgi:hypothetical protein
MDLAEAGDQKVLWYLGENSDMFGSVFHLDILEIGSHIGFRYEVLVEPAGTMELARLKAFDHERKMPVVIEFSPTWGLDNVLAASNKLVKYASEYGADKVRGVRLPINSFRHRGRLMFVYLDVGVPVSQRPSGELFLSWIRVRHFIREMVEALSCFTRLGLVHGHITPDAVWIHEDAGTNMLAVQLGGYEQVTYRGALFRRYIPPELDEDGLMEKREEPTSAEPRDDLMESCLVFMHLLTNGRFDRRIYLHYVDQKLGETARKYLDEQLHTMENQLSRSDERQFKLLKQFIHSCLAVDIKRRLSVMRALRHPLLTQQPKPTLDVMMK